MKFRLFFAVSLVLAFISCQKEPAPEPTISSSAKEENYIQAEGGSLSVKVTTNQETWKYDLGGASWLTASVNADMLVLTASENTAYEPRTTTVKLSASTASTQFNLTQLAAILIPAIEVDVQSPVNVKALPGTLSLDVKTNMESWTCDSDSEWLTASVSGSKLNLSYTENTAELERSAKFTVYTPNKEEYLAKATYSLVQAGADIHYENTDLSAGGTSNCYMISHMGPYTFKATVRGNGKTVTGLDAPTALAPAGAKLVWQTEVGVILSVKLTGNDISFEAGRKPGNALIAATDESGNIIWSWHIWRPDAEPVSIAGEDGSAIMNINLGATTADYSKLGCYGLLYQWGRKDPFPGSDRMNGGTTAIDNIPVYDLEGKVVEIGYSNMYTTKDNTLAYSIAHPTICLAGEAQKATTCDWLIPSESNPALWGNPKGYVYDRDKSAYSNKGSKTYYDPCPRGWRVPYVQVLYHITSLGSLVWAVGDSEGVMTWQNLGGDAEFLGVDINKDGNVNLLDFQNGWWIYLNKSTKKYSFFPATSRYYGYWGQFMGSMVGLWGNYWTNSPSQDSGIPNKSLALGFGIKEYGGSGYSVTTSPTAAGCRNDAYSIRCIKE